MSNYDQYPSAESEVSEETVMELISAAQNIVRTDGVAGSLYDGQKEAWVAGTDDSGGELNIQILAYDHSLGIPEEAKGTDMILEINTSRNYTPKPNGHQSWENHDYIVFNNDGDLAIRKKFDVVASDEPDIYELYRQGRIVYLPTLPEADKEAIIEQALNDQEANRLAEELRMNVPSEQEIRNLITDLAAGSVEHPKNLDLGPLTYEQLHEELRKRLKNE